MTTTRNTYWGSRLILKNKRINHNLEQQAQALFKSWFIDYEPFRDGEFVDSELGRIPKGWEVGCLSDIGNIVGGGTPSKAISSYYTKSGIHWLTPKDLSTHPNKFTSRGEIDITAEGYKSCSAKIMPRGSILFSSRAPIGYISIAQNSICTNQGFKSIVPTVAGTAFLYYLLLGLTITIEAQSSGSTFKEASSSLMKSLKIVIPTKVIMDEFELLLQSIFDIQETNEKENFSLEKLKYGLLPKLMSGELRINDMDE
jgi:type I restriction enzyme, S subunit